MNNEFDFFKCIKFMKFLLNDNDYQLSYVTQTFLHFLPAS